MTRAINRVIAVAALATTALLAPGESAGAATAPVTVRSEASWRSTAPESGAVLYTANWSSGLNGWAGSTAWKTLRGVLLNDGTGNRTPILAPFDAGETTGYAVEARMRVVRAGSIFGLAVRRQRDGGGYSAVIRSGELPAVRYGEDSGSLTDSQPFDPGDGWHVYRLQADGNVVTFLIDGARFATLTDNRFLDGGLSGIISEGYQLEISSYTVARLP